VQSLKLKQGQKRFVPRLNWWRDLWS